MLGLLGAFKLGANSTFNTRSARINLKNGETIVSGPEISRFAKIAVVLKTGKEVALQRTAVQLLTFLKPVKNLILIASSPNVTVGSHAAVDVYTNLYEDATRRLKDGINILIQS
jgi:hypothetical protein